MGEESIEQMTAKEARDEDLDVFRCLIVEYANEDERILTDDAQTLKYELIKILNRNGWFQKH